MQLHGGTSHSLAICGRGKAYCWGWNDNGQCAKDSNLVDEVTVKDSAKVAHINLQPGVNPQSSQDVNHSIRAHQVLAVEDRCYVLCDSGELLAWGSNEKGQLGFGHYTDVHQPTRIEFFSKQNIKVTSIAAGGNLSMAATDNGECFAWPFIKNG